MVEDKKILEILDKKMGLSLKAISKRLGLDEDIVAEKLSQLEDELKVEKKKNKHYVKTEDQKHHVGKLEMSTKGFGFFVNEDKKILIRRKDLYGAFHGDKILIETYHLSDGKTYGKVLKHSLEEQEHVGIVYEDNGDYYVKLDNPKYPFPVLLKGMSGAYIDNKVLVKLSRDIKEEHVVGDVIEVIGHKNDPRVDVLSIMKDLGINDQFSNSVMIQVDGIPTEVLDEDLQGRVDLRNEVIFTIDGDTAKDFDDAISIKVLDNGNYELGVHIADVSYYVKEGSLIDKEALERGTSVYTPGYVTPMLPARLSNGICSLNPDVDRLTMTCKMEINPRGKIVNTDIFESVIHSKKRMTYHDVNEVLDGNAKEDYIPFVETLHKMLELSHILRKAKEKRGSINFDTDEMIIETNENGVPINITSYTRKEAERIIEDFMIAANEAVTTYMSYLNLPFIYRIHEIPDKEKIEQFIATAYKLNLPVEIPLNRGPISAKVLQQQLEIYRGTDKFEILSNLLLRSMKKAQYSKSNAHHYALASRYYTHFTSPIRRYPDLTVHRALKQALHGEFVSSNFNRTEQKYEIIAEHSSMCERRAKECEREVDKMKSAEYLESFIGELFDGKITWMDKKGIYVQLKNLITGIVPADKLVGYNYHDETLTYTSVNHDKIYEIGNSVGLKLVRADKEKRVIEFEIEQKTKKLERIRKI